MTNPNAINFKAALRVRRLNVERLANAIGLTPQQVSNRVREATPWEWSSVIKICDVMNITLEDFRCYYPE